MFLFPGIDCIRGHINRPYRIESAATQPVHYVVAYNEGMGQQNPYLLQSVISMSHSLRFIKKTSHSYCNLSNALIPHLHEITTGTCIFLTIVPVFC